MFNRGSKSKDACITASRYSPSPRKQEVLHHIFATNFGNPAQPSQEDIRVKVQN